VVLQRGHDVRVPVQKHQRVISAEALHVDFHRHADAAFGVLGERVAVVAGRIEWHLEIQQFVFEACDRLRHHSL
jgi:hypothetical protein